MDESEAIDYGYDSSTTSDDTQAQAQFLASGAMLLNSVARLVGPPPPQAPAYSAGPVVVKSQPGISAKTVLIFAGVVVLILLVRK